MKRTSSITLVLILTLLSIFFASCEVSRDEPHTKAYLTEDSLIASVNGMDIVELTKPTTAATTDATLSSAVMRIKLVDGEFQNLDPNTDVTDQWIYPIENRNLGLRFITKNISPNSVDLYVSGTSVLSGVERFENDVQVNIPAKYIYGRNTSVNVEGDKKAKIKIYASTDRVAFVAGSNRVSVSQSIGLGDGAVIRLVNTSFQWQPSYDYSVSSWFGSLANVVVMTPSTSYSTNSTTMTTGFNYSAEYYFGKYGANPMPPTNGSVYPKVTIPTDALTDGEKNGDIECVSYYSYEFISSTYAYIVNPVIIDGVTELSEVDTLEEKDIVIGVVQGTFNNISTADVSSWFYNAPQGLKFTLLDGANLQGKNQMTIRVSGTPLAPSTDEISIRLPDNAITSTSSDSAGSTIRIYVDPNNSFYNIKRGDFYSWNLYDIATFSGTSYNITTNVSSYLNINFNMTKTYDGSDIAFDSQYRLSYGATKEVTFAPGLSRKGYRLKGFAVQEPITRRISNTNDDKSYISINPIYTSDPKSISFTLDEKYKGEPINIFAVWEVDPDSIYWKADSTSITVTKAMIDDANPLETEDAHLSNLTHHDGTALEDTYKQEMSFIVLPGGRIGGTDDSPEYFKWVANYTGSASADFYNRAIKSDIAMADIPLTAAVWNVVYKWATADERGENKYTFDLQQSGVSPMLAGVSYKRATTTYLSRHSAEDPIVRMTWYNAVIFANAMTEWYNNVVLGIDKQAQWLGVAYTDDSTSSGKTLRDATDTTTLNKINPEEYSSVYDDAYKGIKHVADATGFRLPTRAEWLYAAMCYPESDWTSAFKTVSYPQILNSSYISGLNEAPYKSGDSTNSPNPKLKDYAVWQELYNKDADYGTQTVGKYFKADNVRTNGAKPNFVGIYDMSGNVWEWNEDWYQGGAPKNRHLSGGSWGKFASNLYVGNANFNSPSNRSNYYSIRFCRTLSPQTNQTK